MNKVYLTNVTVLPNEITLDHYSLEVEIADDTKKITAAVNADATNQEVEWESLDTGKATVNNSGQIFPKALGQVTLRVKAKGNPSITKDCSVTVVYNKVPYDEGLTTLKTFVNNIGDARTDYIELTEGWTGARFKGSTSGTYSETDFSISPSPVGAAIKAAPSTKKVYLKMPQGVSDLTDMTACFAECTQLVQIDKIPASVTNMTGTFYKCTGFTVFPALPQNVNFLNFCFAKTNAQSYPEVPGTAQDISWVFSGCENMSTAPKLNEGIKNMRGAFMSCKKLTTPPVLPTTVTDLSRTFLSCGLVTPPAIPGNVTNLDETFQSCRALTAVPANYPSGLKSMNATFLGCQSLVNADTPFPVSVKDLTRTFSDCSKLKSVAPVPESVTNMLQCFKDCTVLEEVTLHCPCPQHVNHWQTFSGCKYANFKVKVKSQYLADYRKAAAVSNNSHPIGCTADKFAAQ